MCGFVGYIDKQTKDRKLIKKMGEMIIHRGPDNEDYYIDESISMVIRGLNKDDSKSECKVLKNEKESMILMADATIYNYEELKQTLIQKGHLFKTDSNAEIIIHGYEEYGKKMVSMLRGMFAFVIWDKKKGELFGARDYFGIKPFYYYKIKDTFIWGSEIKSFLPHPHFKKEVNKDALKPYLTFQYSVLEETFFKDVYRLNQGRCFTYKNGKLKIESYYDYSYKTKKSKLSELILDIHNNVAKSVKCHQLNDAQIGAFLSGGIDSSYITSLLKPKTTYSVGFAYKEFNETNDAKDLSDILKIKNKRKLITADDFFKVMEKVQYHSDEPHANLSAVPLYFLSELARKDVKVVMSGEGADELYGGYGPYKQSKMLLLYRKLPIRFRRGLKNKVIKMPNFKGKNFLIRGGSGIEDYYIGQAFIFDDKGANEVLNKEYKSNRTFKSITKPYFDCVKDKDDITKMQYLDMNLWLPNDILLKADKMTMAHSLEARMPFLDKNVFEHSLGIPSKYKIYKGITKYALRKASKNSLPLEWSKRKKKGFPVPFSIWLKEEKYYNKVKEIFNSDFASEFFDVVKINKLLDNHYKGVQNTARKVYTIYTFLIWYKVYFVSI
ncbi:MAG: asparagine synthase (glutamine-hydrolyzing) [Bacilli bacterium]|nr:asparagine synthase (glutamine-hydrolyzing) [Bacilli bacterium]